MDEPEEFDLTTRLRGAERDDGLPSAVRSSARSLADRLEGGVCIVVLGPKSVGKSALCNALFHGLVCGQQSDDRTQHRCFMERRQGAATRFPAEIHSVTLASCPFGHAQVIDLAMPDTAQGFPAVAAEALERADIVLWCTQSFSSDEARSWSTAPDALKDHSILVLTQADRLAEAGILQERVTALQEVAAEEFHSLLPTTTAPLRPAIESGQPVPAEQFAAAGLKALVDAVSAMVSSGQRADLDNALLLLEKNGLLAGDPPANADESEQVQTSEEFKSAQQLLVERALDLAEMGFDEAEDDMSEILALCGTISEELVDAIDAEVVRYPHLAPWRDSFQDGSDKVMLMSMENDTCSATDAVAILLQMRRDMAALEIQ